MSRHKTFVREEIYPSWFVNAQQDFLSAAHTEFKLRKTSGTQVGISPEEPPGITAIAIQGHWRFRTSAVTRSHPGGSAGTYDIWAVGTADDVDNSPLPYSDHTDYSYDLRITAHGVDPSGTGVVIFEKIGELEWDGSAITELTQLYAQIHGPALEDGALVGGGTSAGATVTRQADGSLKIGALNKITHVLSFTLPSSLNYPAAGEYLGEYPIKVRAGQRAFIEAVSFRLANGSGTILDLRRSEDDGGTFADVTGYSNVTAGTTRAETDAADVEVFDGDLIAWRVDTTGSGRGGHYAVVIRYEAA